MKIKKIIQYKNGKVFTMNGMGMALNGAEVSEELEVNTSDEEFEKIRRSKDILKEAKKYSHKKLK